MQATIKTAASATSLVEGDIILWDGANLLVEDVDLDGDTAVILVTDSSLEDCDLPPVEVHRDTLLPITSPYVA